MLSLIPLLLPSDDARQVLQRLDSFLTEAPSISVEMNIHRNSTGEHGRAILRMEKPGRTYFEVRLPKGKFAFSAHEEGSTEISWPGKSYFEGYPSDRFGVFPSKLTDVFAHTFPYLLLGTKVIPPGSSIASVGKVKVNGLDADHLTATWADPELGTIKCEFFIDNIGRPVRFDWMLNAPENPRSARFDFVKVASGSPKGLSSFIIEPPVGFIPFGLPTPFLPLPVGWKGALGTWRDIEGREIDLSKAIEGKTSMLFVGDDKCIPSKAARKGLATLHDIHVVLLNSERSGGTSIALLNPQVTPTFYLFGSDGVLKRVWYGYDESRAKAILEDMQDAIAADK